jgi:hypothetical protein
MKTLMKSLAIGLAGSLSLDVFRAAADLEVSASVQIRAEADFHAPLTPHGAWVEVGSYGRCWRPAHVAVDWRPYCDGHWEWTDCGWYWVSDEPWAWACYHYGTWVYDSPHGWIWVPGIEWAPAWVSWRIGGGYCGWAPLAPRGIVIAPRAFVFVETRRFHDHVRPSTVIVNNTTIINKTTVVAGHKRESRNIDGAGTRNVVINEGPGVAVIEKASGKKMQQVSVREVDRKTPVPQEIARRTPQTRNQVSPQRDRGPGEDRKPAPRSEKDVKPAPERPSKGEVRPGSERPPVPTRPPSKSDKSPRGKDKGDKGGKRDGKD